MSRRDARVMGMSKNGRVSRRVSLGQVHSDQVPPKVGERLQCGVQLQNLGGLLTREVKKEAFLLRGVPVFGHGQMQVAWHLPRLISVGFESLWGALQKGKRGTPRMSQGLLLGGTNILWVWSRCFAKTAYIEVIGRMEMFNDPKPAQVVPRTRF